MKSQYGVDTGIEVEYQPAVDRAIGAREGEIDMQLPIINHLTGTDKNDLLQDYILAKRALEHAAERMSGVWPHGRDYQNGGDINAAMREHAARCAKIKQVIAEIEIIAEAII